MDDIFEREDLRFDNPSITILTEAESRYVYNVDDFSRQSCTK